MPSPRQHREPVWKPVNQRAIQSVSQLWQQQSEIIWSMWCMCLHLALSLCLSVCVFLPRSPLRPPPVWLSLHLSASPSASLCLLQSDSLTSPSPLRALRPCSPNVWTRHSFSQLKLGYSTSECDSQIHWSADSFIKFSKGVTTSRRLKEKSGVCCISLNDNKVHVQSHVSNNLFHSLMYLIRNTTMSHRAAKIRTKAQNVN